MRDTEIRTTIESRVRADRLPRIPRTIAGRQASGDTSCAGCGRRGARSRYGDLVFHSECGKIWIEVCKDLAASAVAAC